MAQRDSSKYRFLTRSSLFNLFFRYFENPLNRHSSFPLFFYHKSNLVKDSHVLVWTGLSLLDLLSLVLVIANKDRDIVQPADGAQWPLGV